MIPQLMINFDFPVHGLFMCIQWQYSFWNGTILLKRNSLVHLNHPYLQARWILKILSRMVLILFKKNKKEKAIKGTLLQSKANISLVCTSYTNMKHKWQVLEVLWSWRRRDWKACCKWSVDWNDKGQGSTVQTRMMPQL